MFGLRLTASAAISLVFLGTFAFAQGNGTERGGGEVEAQNFQTAGHEAVTLLRGWKAKGINLIPELDLDRMDAVIDGTHVHMSSVMPVLDSEGKDAVNTPSKHAIEVYQPEWDARKADPVERPSFALHEFLAIYPLPDANYQLSSRLEARLRLEDDLVDFRADFKARLSRLDDLLERPFTENFQTLKAQVQLIESSTDYTSCVAPPRKAKKVDRLDNCLAATGMVMLSASLISGPGASATAANSQLQTLEQFMAMVENMPELKHRKKDVERIRARLQSMLSRSQAAGAQVTPAGDPVPAALAELNAYMKAITLPARQQFVNDALHALVDRYNELVTEVSGDISQFNASYQGQCPGNLQAAVRCALPLMVREIDGKFVPELGDGAAELRKIAWDLAPKIDAYDEK
jgi:hypothetical protein